MAHVSVDGLGFWVEHAGEGPPVFLLHGFTGTAGTWSRITPALADDFATYAVDLVGHGRSSSVAPPERYAMDRAVDDLVEVMRGLGHERAVWAGYSLGGRTALQLAVHHPQAVSALILEGASPGLPTEEERAARVRADEHLARMLEDEGLEAFVDHWQSIPLWDSQQQHLTEEQRNALRAGRLQQSPVGLAQSLGGMGTGSQTWVGERLAEVRVPVLLTAGSLDTKYVEIAREMAATLPNATLRVIEDAGHAAHLERPEAFASTVLAFLRGVRSSL